MNTQKEHMINIARNIYQEIHPCSSKTELSDCFTTEGNILIFWFNTNDESTHVLTMNLQK